MNQPTAAMLDVIIIGAGHAGLSMSYFLKKKQCTPYCF